LEKLSTNDLQVLIVAPTREIAIQIQQVCTEISTYIQCSVEYFVGGFPVDEGVKITFSYRPDIEKLKNCQIAIGTPGRLTQLIASKYMKIDKIKLLILDEADVLFQEQFEIK
jgi:superfamily II DNA/RNA helicase